MSGHFAVSTQTRPFFTGSVVADLFFTNFGRRGARGFHLAPPALTTRSAKRAAIIAGASVLRYPSTGARSSPDIRRKISTARSSVLPPRRITAGISRSSSQNAFASPYADQYCSCLAPPEPEPNYPTRPGWDTIIRLARCTFDADRL